MTKEFFSLVEASMGFSRAVRELSGDVKTIHRVSDIVDYVKDLIDEKNFVDAAELLASMAKARKSEWYEYDFSTPSTPPRPLSSFEDFEKFLN